MKLVNSFLTEGAAMHCHLLPEVQQKQEFLLSFSTSIVKVQVYQ